MLQRLEMFKFSGICEDTLAVEDVIASAHVYEQNMIKVVRNNASYVVNNLNEYLELSTYPIKIEGYERFNSVMFRECKALASHMKHQGFVSCHLFLSPKASVSFAMHTDPDDVVVHMVKGRKLFESPDGVLELSEGQSIYIPRNYPHRAINTEDSIMLSFGLELFTEQKLWA